jgi:predicted peptidase
MRLTLELLKDIIEKQPIDIKRVYVTGLSMGGFGTWDIVQRIPELFAAAIPICGGGDTTMADTIKNIPIWAFHGDMDSVVPPKYTRNMIAAIKRYGGNPKYTEYKGVNHDSWSRTYKNPNVLEWMFLQTKSK